MSAIDCLFATSFQDLTWKTKESEEKIGRKEGRKEGKEEKARLIDKIYIIDSVSVLVFNHLYNVLSCSVHYSNKSLNHIVLNVIDL